MSRKTFTYLDEEFTACDCHCHSEPSIRHILPCCDLTYSQYINKDGTLNEDQLDKALERVYNWRMEQRRKKDGN